MQALALRSRDLTDGCHVVDMSTDSRMIVRHEMRIEDSPPKLSITKHTCNLKRSNQVFRSVLNSGHTRIACSKVLQPGKPGSRK